MGRDSSSSSHMQCCYRDSVAFTLYSRFCVPKLFHYAVSGDWDKIPIRCQTHPKEASFVHKYPPYDTALHRIVRPSIGERYIRQESDYNTIQKLDAIKMNAIQAIFHATNNEIGCYQDSFGRTPLHLSCMDVCGTVDVAIGVLQANSIAASILDSEQRTPLHLLCARNDTIPIQLIEVLIDAYTLATTIVDITGDTPIDIVRMRHDEINNADDVIQVLSKYTPSPPTNKTTNNNNVDSCPIIAQNKECAPDTVSKIVIPSSANAATINTNIYTCT
jgi:hypothetical protein